MLELELAETVDSPFLLAPWAGPLIALGARAFRFSSDPARLGASDQLFLAITVPTRDFAACLIAAGWMMTAQIRRAMSVNTQLDTLQPGSLVRMITKQDVILDEYSGVEADTIKVGKTRWKRDKIARIAPVPELGLVPRRNRIATPPSFGPYSNDLGRWLDFLLQPPSGLALVGAKMSLLDDMDIQIGVRNSGRPPTLLKDIILPADGKSATWATDLIIPSRLSDDSDQTPEYHAVVLDGASAVKSSDLIDAPLVIAVIDRGIMDETAAELVVQRRNSPLSNRLNSKDLGWEPPSGIEIVCFRTRR